MKVYVAHDGALRVRIGHETLGSESLGPWYGGTGAVRLRQVGGGWFRAYRLDDHGHRGTAALPEAEFWRVLEHLPGACVTDASGSSLSLQVPDGDLRLLQEKVAPLRTRLARFGPDLAAMFGDFEIAAVAGSAVGLFHLGGRRFNAFRTPDRARPDFAALDTGAGMRAVAARLPSALLRREGEMSVVEVDNADLALLTGMAGAAWRSASARVAADGVAPVASGLPCGVGLETPSPATSRPLRQAKA